MDQLIAKPVEQPTLLKFMRQNVRSMLQYVSMKIFAKSTYDNYSVTTDKVEAFIQHKFNGKDIFLKDLTSTFLTDFEQYLKVYECNKHSTAARHCLNLKRIIGYAVDDSKLQSNPFKNYRGKYDHITLVYLDENDLHTLINSKIKNPAHLLARDLFLFQCYTGLGFNAMLKLNAADIIEVKGRKCNIQLKHPSDLVKVVQLEPMLPQAVAILEKYAHNSPNDFFKPTFPGLTLYDYNKHLKKVAFFACMKKKLNTLTARNTFNKIRESS